MTLDVQPGSIAQSHGTVGFGIENLPLASFTPDGAEGARLGVRIGEHVLDVQALVGADAGASTGLRSAAGGTNLDNLLSAGRSVWDDLRALLVRALSSASEAHALTSCLHELTRVQLHLPFTVADYVDFYASEHHASNVGRIFRPDQAPLLPNWKHLPVGYHGRAGTIVPTGTCIRRPKGLRPGTDGVPSFGPSQRLDIEAEMGFVLGGDVPAGEVKMQDAREHIFGLVLVNDWSARDIQAFEYVPLGPFLGKSFATSIGAWVVQIAALEAARTPPPPREKTLAAYLDDSGCEHWGFDVSLEIQVDGEPISSPQLSTLYWTGAQMLAHMTVNGAGLRSGDLFASGTISGAGKDQRGSFLEMCWGGKEPLRLSSGKEMTFLEDKTVVTITAAAPGPDGSVIGFGDVSGRILPAT
jgi:fumarylacetoacetase